MNASKFTKIQVVSTLVSLLPIVIYLIAWSNLPEQMQVNVMPSSLYLSRAVVGFVIPIIFTIVHIILTFVIRNHSIKENKPNIMWLSFLMPVMSILGSIPILNMNI